jgi:hypothetical protein
MKPKLKSKYWLVSKMHVQHVIVYSKENKIGNVTTRDADISSV